MLETERHWKKLYSLCRWFRCILMSIQSSLTCGFHSHLDLHINTFLITLSGFQCSRQGLSRRVSHVDVRESAYQIQPSTVREMLQNTYLNNTILTAVIITLICATGWRRQGSWYSDWNVRSSKLGWGREFPGTSRPAPRLTQPLHNWYRLSFSRTKRSGHGAVHLPSCRAEFDSG